MNKQRTKMHETGILIRQLNQYYKSKNTFGNILNYNRNALFQTRTNSIMNEIVAYFSSLITFKSTGHATKFGT